MKREVRAREIRGRKAFRRPESISEEFFTFSIDERRVLRLLGRDFSLRHVTVFSEITEEIGGAWPTINCSARKRMNHRQCYAPSVLLELDGQSPLDCVQHNKGGMHEIPDVRPSMR